MTTAVIEIQSLTKTYDKSKKPALNGLTLRVNRGEIFGYLGPNGAGKTTTIRMLLDLIRPTMGYASVFGLDVNRDSLAIRRRVGFLPGELALWDNQTAIEIIRYFGKVRGGVEMAYVRELADRLQFDLSKKMRAYSTGNKRKLGLILAMMHKPELLILDEPTSGLDPLMQQIFNQMMHDARQSGQTVFLSSHVLSEVQAICDRVAILRDGQLQAVEEVEKLTRVDFRWVTVRLREPAADLHFTDVEGISDVETNGKIVKLRLSGDFDPLLRALNGHYVENVHIQEPSLEDIFLTYYSGIPNVNGRTSIRMEAVS
ncbi:MAG: ABC transporter [Phototrophicales bacterium]|nr:MAG: ABC transporter [Phototrophicales bacterium]